jgi:hypothetical protein
MLLYQPAKQRSADQILAACWPSKPEAKDPNACQGEGRK